MKIILYENNEKDASKITKYIRIILKEKKIECEIKICLCSEELIELSFHYDIVLLNVDLDLEKKNDIGFMLRRRNGKIRIIIISAHTKYLIDGYKIHADLYLMKPIDQKFFNKEFESIVDHYFLQEIYDSKISNMRISIKDILYIDYFNRKTRIHCSDGLIYNTPYSLKYWIDYFSEKSFSQVHRAFLVNLENVNRYDKNTILMINKESLFLARSFKKEFIANIINFQLNK